MRERDVEQYFIRRVREAGGLQRKFVSPGVKGVADRICGFPFGRIVFVELKAPGQKPRPDQSREFSKWRKLGYDTWILDSKESVDDFIKQVGGLWADSKSVF